jgi:SAM-dependent methyltransferase
MSLTRERQVEWEARYQAGRTGWDRGGVSPALRHWRASGELSGGRILVPGCGRGHEVAALARDGFRVTALDIAPSAVGHLRDVLEAQGLEAELVEADVLHWAPAAPFPVIYEQTSLCALPPADWPAYARCLGQWLEPGGRIFALFMQTCSAGGPPFHCGVDEMRRLFPAEGWRWLDREPLHVPHPTGLHELGFVLQRR